MKWLPECSVAALREALAAVAPELSGYPVTVPGPAGKQDPLFHSGCVPVGDRFFVKFAWSRPAGAPAGAGGRRPPPRRSFLRCRMLSWPRGWRRPARLIAELTAARVELLERQARKDSSTSSRPPSSDSPYKWCVRPPSSGQRRCHAGGTG